MTINKIELISTNILSQHPELAHNLETMNKNLALSSGWHYILDWVWTLCQIEVVNGKVILDAGAGIGLMQWYLSSMGAHVISADRSDRTCIPFHLVNQFQVDGLTPADKPLNISETLNIFNGKANLIPRIKAVLRGAAGTLKNYNHEPAVGSVKLYKKDLSTLTEIPSNSVDIIVSISALEHNDTIDKVKEVAEELLRVLKPGGRLIATLPASRKTDWFFDPAHSWCFTDMTIKDIFGLSANTPTNYSQYDKIFKELKTSGKLMKSLSWRYYYSKSSGMPLGRWEPQYIPVGVLKTKS